MLPLQGVRVQSQVGELGSCMPLGAAKGKKKAFSFLFSLGDWKTLLCLSVHWSVPLYHLICCWFLLVYFFLLVIVSFALFGSPLYFLTLLEASTFSLSLSSFCPSSLRTFVIIALDSLLGRSLISTLLSSFGVLSYSFIWNIFLCHFILPDSVFISVY